MNAEETVIIDNQLFTSGEADISCANIQKWPLKGRKQKGRKRKPKPCKNPSGEQVIWSFIIVQQECKIFPEMVS